MSIDLAASEQFVFANARLLDRHRLAVLLHSAPVEPVLETLRAYRNSDGGFGHALEPDVRGPLSEVAAAVHVLEVLAEVGALGDPMAADVAAWCAIIARADGSVTFVLPSAARFPRAPWMQPTDEASFLTFALAARLWEAESTEPWLERATEWCWTMLSTPADLTGWWVKWALDFLDHVPDEPRVSTAIERLRPQIGPDGCVRVPGGTEDEKLTPLVLSPRPDTRSRMLFSDSRIESDLDLLEAGQQDDGGWTFDWLAWSAGQAVEWRGLMTLRALVSLAAHKRIVLHAGGSDPQTQSPHAQMAEAD
jgi:hypothetical protein